jgi:hypothetical protein
MFDKILNRWIRWRHNRWEDRQLEELERRIAKWRGDDRFGNHHPFSS